jgi:hypothetical protein
MSEESAAGAARARFDAEAMIGRPVPEAVKHYRAQGFVVMVERQDGAHVLSFMATRVRLIDRDGLVVEAHLG